MQREKVQLPSLYQPITSSRIANFQDYSKWEKAKKQAYRDELRKQIVEHNLSRENLLVEKKREREQINAIVKNERLKIDYQRHNKIKTEQKYMKDNWNMMKQTSRISPQRNNPQEEYKQHPLIRLVDQQERRQTQTKNNFIFQNKLNDIQSSMKRQQSVRRKLYECEQRKRLDEHVENQYRRKRKERQQFQNKYLKIDKSSTNNCNKQYLQYLKAQLTINRNDRIPKELNNYLQEANQPSSPGNIGLFPAAHDRIKQLQTLEKSLNMFPEARNSRNNSSFIEHLNNKQIYQNRIRRTPYDKMLTERAATIENRSIPLRTLQKEASYPIESQFSQRVDRPTRPRKQYKQYDLISGNEKIFLN